MESNPKDAVDAIVSQKPLSLVKMAILEKAKSPVLELEVSDLCADIKAAYLYSLPVADALAALPDADEKSLVWLEEVGEDEYRRLFSELVDSLIEFYRMLPPTKKKTEQDGSETAGAPNS